MFDYKEEIRSVMGSSSLRDPHDVAAKVSEQVPSRELRGVVRALLPLAVRDEIRSHRDDSPVPKTERHGRSRWADLATSRPMWAVNGEGYQFLDELTLDQVRALAAQYQLKSEQMQAKSDRFTRLGDAMVAAGVDLVGDLPVDVFEQVWT